LNIVLPVKDLNKSPPSAVYEMADENGDAKMIFEIYYNWTNCQRLLAFKPKRTEKIPEKSNVMLEKDTGSEIRIRSEEDLMNADSDVKLGYRRMCQFISLAESRIPQGTLRNAFGLTGCTVELKYNGALEMSTIDGRKVVKKASDNEPTGDALSESELRIFQASARKLRETADLGAFRDVAPKRSVIRPFVISW